MEIIRLLVFCLAAVILYKVVKSDRKKGITFVFSRY